MKWESVEMIELKQLTKTFDVGKTALTAVDDVNLTIADGEIFGIIGYSGAGKSTLIRILNGLEKPTSGTVDINGQKITDIKFCLRILPLDSPGEIKRPLLPRMEPVNQLSCKLLRGKKYRIAAR